MNWDLIVMSIMYAFAGIMHFIKPKAYIKVMPRYLKARKSLVLLSGVFEIALGVGLLFDATRSISALGIILMLIVFLLVHFNMLRGKKYAVGVPRWVLILRIPLQFVLIWWAYLYI
ncbi:DoxX family protein [Psychroflexus montanilacus]|uniref:DoxX family protein n=1 Tax=Psychroflexus montanilacus TaxID=2873598 RepID=UPI001CCB85A3|nr:DoxX family protein [Psychroflexus montanilacus]MBZ9651719.1 DoxX family protein [Psychroflexus montanilacus]